MAIENQVQEIQDRYDDSFLAKVWASAKRAYEALEDYRRIRRELLEEYIGANYATHRFDQPNFWNLIEQASNVYRSLLIAAPPKVTVVTKSPAKAEFAPELMLALNYIIDKINLQAELDLAFIDSLFSIGTIKVGISPTSFGANPAQVDQGEYYADAVSFDDLVLDPYAPRLEHTAFIGNRYIVGVDTIAANPWIPEQTRQEALKHAASLDSLDRREPLDQSAERLTNLRDKAGESLEKVLHLWDIWVRKENLLITYVENMKEPLWVRPWMGPPTGPYRFLYYYTVPKQVMPWFPAAGWIDNHLAVNKLLRKAYRQVSRLKTIMAVMATQQHDGERIVSAADGEAVPVVDPNAHREFRFGGLDPDLVRGVDFFRAFANVAAGNVDLLAGLRPQSPTLGQDQILSANATERLRHMRNSVLAFIKNIVYDIAVWVWDDPFLEVKGMYTIPGTQITIPLSFRPNRRIGTLQDYGIEVVPHSLEYRSGADRMLQLIQIVQNMLLPLYPLMQREGLTLSTTKLISYMAQYFDLPELLNLVTHAKMTPEAIDAAMRAVPTQQPADSASRAASKTYASQDSQLAASIASLLAQNTQPQEQ